MALYKWTKGTKVKLSSREAKAYIMKVNNWTSEEYNKNYDILRNKVRAYENYQKSRGLKVEKQSVVELLYKEAYTKKREGENYKPSIKMQRIRAFTSVSSGKAGQKALQGKVYMARRGKLYEDATYRQFKGFIDNNMQARYIYENINDPVKREKALSDLANKLHAKIKENDEEANDEAIPYSSEVYGSDDTIDFDIEQYL